MFVISASEPLLIEDIWCDSELTHIISHDAQNHHEEFINYICEHFDKLDPCNFYFFLIHDKKHCVQIADYKNFIDKFKTTEVYFSKEKFFKHLTRYIIHFQLPFINKLDENYFEYINEDGTLYNGDNTFKLLHEEIFGNALDADTCFDFCSLGSCIIHGEFLLEKGKTFFTKIQNILACKKIPKGCECSIENDFLYIFWEKILTGFIVEQISLNIEGTYEKKLIGCEGAPGCEGSPGCEGAPGCEDEATGCEPNVEYSCLIEQTDPNFRSGKNKVQDQITEQDTNQDIKQDTEQNTDQDTVKTPIKSFRIENLQTMEIISLTEIEIDYDIPEHLISHVKESSCCEDCNYCRTESNTHKFRICGSACFKKIQAAMQ
jgi:hypothetical protein